MLLESVRELIPAHNPNKQTNKHPTAQADNQFGYYFSPQHKECKQRLKQIIPAVIFKKPEHVMFLGTQSDRKLKFRVNFESFSVVKF